MKLVGVSQRVDCHPERHETRDALDRRLVEWLAEAGYGAVPIPNATYEHRAENLRLDPWLDSLSLHALVLSGGNDVGSQPERDTVEAALLRWAKRQQSPVLGICRGMQFMAVQSGMALKKVRGHTATRHGIQWVASTAPQPVEVNSFHDWGVLACPSGYEALAWAEDGSLEAMRHTQLPWEGWMWHPERETPFVAADIQRVQRLFN